MGRREVLARSAVAALGAAAVAAVAVMAGRVDDTARFVTWPVVGLTAVAATTAVVGVWSGRTRPGPFLAGLLLALPVAYVLPVAPLAVVAAVLVGLGALAVRTGAGAAGVAAGVGCSMVLLVLLQGPAVECGRSSISTNSGPWWVGPSGSSTSSGQVSPAGTAHGTTQVGDRHYEYSCDGDRLTSFRRAG